MRSLNPKTLRELRDILSALREGRKLPPADRLAHVEGVIAAATKTKRAVRSARKVRTAKRETRKAQLNALRHAVFERAAGRCEYCQIATPTDLEHVFGGRNRRALESFETCLAICWECHRARHNSTHPEDWLNMYLRHAIAHGYRKGAAMAEQRLLVIEGKHAMGFGDKAQGGTP